MSPGDLCGIAAVKLWSNNVQTSSDASIAAMITGVSRNIYAYLNRSTILPKIYVETFSGSESKSARVLRNFPVNSVSAVSVDGLTIPPAANQVAVGWLLDQADPEPPSRASTLRLRGYSFGCGVQNATVTYSAGYQVSGEAASVPAGGGNVTAAQPFGDWASDVSVSYADTGALLAKVASGPALGQYSVSRGVYTFSPADAGASVLLSYGFIPADLRQACVESVALRWSQRTSSGFRSKSLGGQETTTYDNGDLPSSVRLALNPYRRVTP